jgi:hypothetical protein
LFVSSACDWMLHGQNLGPVQQSAPFARLNIHKLQPSRLKFSRLMV